MFTGARFMVLAPLLVPSYVLALWLRQLKMGEGTIYLLPFPEESFPFISVAYSKLLLSVPWLAPWFSKKPHENSVWVSNEE